MEEVEDLQAHKPVRRTTTKMISEAFHFLNDHSDAGYFEDEINGIPRISTSISDATISNIRQRDPSINHSNARQHQSLPANVFDGNMSSQIQTGVDNRNATRKGAHSYPGQDRPAGLSSNFDGQQGPLMNHSERNGGMVEDSKGKTDEYTIVTYVEHDPSSPQMKEPPIDTVVIIEPVETAVSSGTEGVVMRLKSKDSPARAESMSQVHSWQQNQKVVSEAFQFLKEEIEGITDTTSMMSFQFPDHEVSVGPKENNDGANVSSVGNPDVIPKGSKVLSRGEAFDKSDSSFNTESEKHSIDGGENSQNGDGNQSSVAKQTSAPLPSSLENVILNAAANQIKLEQASEISSESSEADDIGDLNGAKLRNRRKNKSQNPDDDDDGSSDEDTGVYRESFRKSTWLFVGDNGELSVSGQESLGTKESGFVSLSELGVEGADSVFDLPPESSIPSPLKMMTSHKRSESTTTTVSEKEFRNAYNSVRNRVVQRKDSQLEYKRITEKFYDQQKTHTLTKESEDSGYGIHLLHNRPAIISSVDKGTPADLAGVREGQIVISINSVNVLDADHEEIVRLVQENSTSMELEVGYSDVQCIRDLQIPILSGYLQKQTTTIFKTWKRRFFILRHDNCLYYYKTHQETDPLGAIQLSGYIFSRHGDLNKFGFKAEKFGNRSYFFLADNREEMTRWVGALNESAEKGKEQKDVWMDVTSHNVGLPALEIRKPDCSGYLFKMARTAKNWRKRYCVLKDACIYYYKSSSSKEAQGVAHLHGYQVDAAGIPSKKFSIRLLPPEPDMRVFYFYTDNDTDHSRWVEALTKSIQKWVRVDG